MTPVPERWRGGYPNHLENSALLCTNIAMQNLEEALVVSKPFLMPFIITDRLQAAETRASSLISTERYDDALKAAIEAVENCIKAREQAPTFADRQRLRTKIEELMAKAESIKKLQNTNNEGAGLNRVEAHKTPPTSLAKLTVKEETLLLKSSRVDNHVFPPWKDPLLIEDFFLETAPFS